MSWCRDLTSLSMVLAALHSLCYTVVVEIAGIITQPQYGEVPRTPSHTIFRGDEMTAKERSQRWREKQLKERPEEFRKYNADRAKSLYHSNPEVAQNQQKNFKKSYDENPEFREKIIRAASMSRYGTTPAKYDEQLEKQNGHCALCESTDGDAGRRLHIDHDHECCKVGPPRGRTCGKCNRGLLCGPCNRHLAAVEDLLKQGTIVPLAGTWLSKALAYLDSYKKS